MEKRTSIIVLHAQRNSIKIKIKKNDTSTLESNDDTESGMIAIGEKVIMQTALMAIKGNDSIVTTRALFNTGNTRSYVTEEVANSLKLKPIEEQTFLIYAFGDTKSKQKTASIVELKIQTRFGKSIKIKATVTKQISGLLLRTPLQLKNQRMLKQQHDLADTLPSQMEIYTLGILIGNDHYYDRMLDKREVVQENLYVLESKLGWVLSGRTTIREPQDENILFLLPTSSDIPSELHKMKRENQIAMFKPNVEDLWNLENIGIKPKEKGESDDFVMDWFKGTVSRKDKRYFVSWARREENESHLPENSELSLGRLKSLIKRLEKNLDLLEKYNNIIQEQFAKDIIERVESSEEGNENRKHYIPHHAVITPEKSTTKIRIVYDASAKIKRNTKSLNECLYRRSVILEDVCGLLLRFRMKKIGLVSDIEKAFLQVGLHEADRDVTRFLWLKDIKKPVSKENLLVCRFKRLPLEIISSPLLLGATIKHHLEKENSATAKNIKNDFYVDNLISEADSKKNAARLYRDAKRLFKDISMNLREWLI